MKYCIDKSECFVASDQIPAHMNQQNVANSITRLNPWGHAERQLGFVVALGSWDRPSRRGHSDGACIHTHGCGRADRQRRPQPMLVYRNTPNHFQIIPHSGWERCCAPTTLLRSPSSGPVQQ